ncbi:MAG: sensor histidine kinase, partial [Chryseobacterium sp.]
MWLLPIKKDYSGRLGDAIKGRQQTKTDTVVITNSQENSVDIAALQEDLRNVVKVANQQYRERIKEIRTKQIIKQNSNSVLYGLFGKLLASSNNLLEAYDMAVEAYRAKLDLQYREQVEKNNSIRSRTVLSLMVLMFIVSIIIIYYIKQSFDYERKLRTANELINKNLSFKNRIIGMIGHEMRAPMQIMNIFMDRIAKVIQDGKVSEYLKSMKFTNNSLLVQANQILEYAKNTDKKSEAECTVFNLWEHIHSILVAFEAFAESRNNRLVIHNEIPKNLTIYSDFAKIYQLFTNILSNANKFTDNGQIVVYSSITAVDPKKTKLHVSISDNGMGISEDELTEIFKPYHRGMISDKVANIG